jgi:hypothetical protein
MQRFGSKQVGNKPRKSFAKILRVIRAAAGFQAGLIVLAFQFLVWPSDAQVVLVDNNATAAIDLHSQRGMYEWAVDGQNQLQQEWFWYGVGSSAVQSLDTISAAPTVVMTGAREATATYVSAGNFSVSVDYALSGGSSAMLSGASGQAVADITETIQVVNLSAGPLLYHFYEYSYFNLQAGSRDIAQLGQDLSGAYNEAFQYSSNASLTETVTAPGADHGEVAPLGLTLAKLNNGGAVTLGSPFGAGPVGPGAVTWALEWDLNIPPGASAIISKDKYLNVLPEPSALALFGLSWLVLVLLRKH